MNKRNHHFRIPVQKPSSPHIQASMNSTDSNHVAPNGVGAINFVPILAANAIFLTIFCILLFLHCILVLRFWRYYGYAISMIGGLLLELIGYAAKVQLAHNQSNKNAYIGFVLTHSSTTIFLLADLFSALSLG